MRKALLVLGILVVIPMMLAACGKSQQDVPVIRFMIGSETQKVMDQVVVPWFGSQKPAWKAEYLSIGSLDQANKLKASDLTDTDGQAISVVWTASSVWANIGDTHKLLVNNPDPVFYTPIVVSGKKAVMDKLGWTGKVISVNDLIAAAKSGTRVEMTNPTRSNSGAITYLAVYNYFASNSATNALTMDQAQDPAILKQTSDFFSLVKHDQASTGFMTDNCVSDPGCQVMITYESLVIQHNLASPKDLYGVAYLSDAFMYSDATPMIVASASREERAVFDKWLAYMKSPDAAKQLIALGLRPASVSLNSTNSTNAFNPAWGIKQSLDIPPISLPEAGVVNQLFTAYQTVVRPPYDLRICLDGSGSMSGNGGWNQLTQSLDILLHQDKAAEDQLLMNAKDLTTIRIFNEGARYTSPSIAGADYAAFGKAFDNIRNNVGGNTAMYDCIRWALGGFDSTPADGRKRLLIVMTDGQSNAGGGLENIPNQLRSANAKVIMVGFSSSPDMRQLHSVADPVEGLIIVTDKGIKARDKAWNVYLASSLVDAMKTAFGSK